MKKAIFFVLCMAVAAVELHATVLTFDIDGFPNGQVISGNYGDYVSCSQMGNFHYGLDGGITPNVTVAYAGDRISAAFPTFWNTGYNDLLNVIENETDGDTGYQLTFQADPNYFVQLASFDVGNWGSQIAVPEIRVTDDKGAILFQMTGVVLPAYWVQQHIHFEMPSAVRGNRLVLRIDTTNLGGNSDNIGLDNVRFSQDPPVPSPSPDIDLNGIVDENDLAILAEYWLKFPAPAQLDFVVDCQIDLYDFALLASFWLSAPPQ